MRSPGRADLHLGQRLAGRPELFVQAVQTSGSRATCGRTGSSLWPGCLRCRAPRGASPAARLPSSRSSKARWSAARTPAACQSRRRRQHDMLEPQPIFWSRHAQGNPVCSTNRIPVSAARSGTGGTRLSGVARRAAEAERSPPGDRRGQGLRPYTSTRQSRLSDALKVSAPHLRAGGG